MSPPHLHLAWLVPMAFIPQWLAFYQLTARRLVTDDVAEVILVGSQLLLLVFAWRNRGRPGFWALGIGLGMNLVVITLNGGLMPISPETITRLVPSAPVETWLVGRHLVGSKNILLPTTATHLAWLSDCFSLPSWLPYRVAFSLGDVFIAFGAFWMLWKFGGPAALGNQSCRHLPTIGLSTRVFRRP